MMKTLFAIGLMSGTSLDGLDICYVRFDLPDYQFEIIKAETITYPPEWKEKLKNSIHLSAKKLTKLDFDYGVFLGSSTRNFLEKHSIEKVDFIASHGHTVFHNPAENYTLQIGKGQGILAQTGIQTVFDFRSQDVIFGGQGAPLVPIGDELLFGKFDACLNLGGFSNISFRKNQNRIAFDISPFNILLNPLAEKLGKNYDENGNFARSGNLNFEFLRKLNILDYYQKLPPKSLGVEWCRKEINPLLNEFPDRPENLLASFTEHFAVQIARVLNENSIRNVLVTGGGVYNQFFIENLKSKTECEIIIPDKSVIEFKEALIFAFMGMLRLENKINVLSSVTGAVRNHSSGNIIG
jgi:anhydro-N-acetylmuramic acid kinase